jgi:hypothetical protein
MRNEDKMETREREEEDENTGHTELFHCPKTFEYQVIEKLTSKQF